MIKNIYRIFCCLLLSLTVLLPVYADADEHLKPLAPFVGKTWKTSSGTPDSSDYFTDVARWEWAMNGRAIRILHSVNDGSYGGESLIHFDPEANQIIYRYVTTAGFYTDGVISLTKNGFTAAETVTGMPGTTGTRAGYALKDGRMEVWSQFINDTTDGPINRAIYIEAPDAKVVFTD